MNNASLNQFAEAATFLDMSRSRFKRPFRHLTTFDAGKLIPIYWDEVLPGDTVTMDVGSLVRMTTPIFPVMDNAFLDIHAYFVPNRLLWTGWEEFMGANKTTYWAQPTTPVPPQMTWAPNSQVTTDGTSIADYMGLPLKVPAGAKARVSCLPFRAYALVWNDWYRDENVMQPVSISLSGGISTGNIGHVTSFTYDSYVSGSGASSYVNRGSFGDLPLPVCKLHDFFTSCLPGPQKSSAAAGVALLGTLPVANAPAGTGTAFTPQWYNSMTTSASSKISSGNLAVQSLGTQYEGSSGSLTGTAYLNLQVDLGSASLVTINAIREAFAVQRFLERQARGGTRYTEILLSHFGVHSSDASLQRPQFLGGRRVPINMTQVAQTSAQSSSSATPSGVDSPIATLGAYSQTLDGSHLFTKSFEEHGILLVMACVRTKRSYQQGIAKKFSRTQLTDYYFPVFANLGEKPVYTKELYLWSSDMDDNSVFGYQEAWAEYRYSPDLVSGNFRSDGTTGYDSWHYADYYTSKPTLTSAWMVEPQSNVARTLAVANAPQFLADFAFDATWVRPMPVYSVPGLIDHH